jgi:DNA-binding transcriptional LysR family regulator
VKHRKLRRYFRHGTLTQLSVFEAVARHASFTRAAEELHMAQPTVSIQVKKLAATIGLPLFEMAGKRLRLTGAGRELYAACQDIFVKIAEVEDRLARLRSPASGTLQLAVTTTAKYFAPRLLAQFLERYPAVDAALTVLNREQLLNRLAGSLDDFYILSDPPEEMEVVLQTLVPNPFYVYARADHPLARRRRLRFADVAAEPFLLREVGSGTRRVVEQLFEDHGRAPSVRMELGSNEAIKQAILGGLGIAVLSAHSMAPGTVHEGIVPLDVQGFPLRRWWYLVFSEGRTLSPTAQAFLEAVRTPGWLAALQPGKPPALARPKPA